MPHGINYSPTADTIRRALRILVERGQIEHGTYQRLATHYGLSRERVRQLAQEVKREQVGLSRVRAGLGPREVARGN